MAEGTEDRYRISRGTREPKPAERSSDTPSCSHSEKWYSATGTAPCSLSTGRPRGSALNTARYGFAYPFLKHRDFVVIETRGARFAEPSLVCPEVPSARIEDATRAPDLPANTEIRAARKCREQTVEKGIDPSSYNTAR